jgi:gamma-glutamyltranspeptidase/glutathione hydrolase
MEMLAAEGNAIDAAVAAAFALGSSDPGGSGLGGATWMLIRFPNGQSLVLDGTPHAPIGVDVQELQRLQRRDHLLGHRLAAAPTTVAVLDLAHSRYGRLRWSEVLKPAIEIAERGGRVTPTAHAFLGEYAPKVAESAVLSARLLRNGRPLPVGARARLPGLSWALRRLATHGGRDFYRGGIARMIESDMKAHGGYIRRIDLARVQVEATRPVRGSYRGLTVLSAPRWTGGTQVVLALRILDQLPSLRLQSMDAERHRILAETARWARLASGHPRTAEGALMRAPELREKKAREIADRVRNPPFEERGEPQGSPQKDGNTTHLVVADSAGTVVSLTQTLGRYFGACSATPALGFPYNSLLEHVGLESPEDLDYLRPQMLLPTSVAPTVLTDADGELVAALGSSGSERVLSAILNCVSNLVDRGLSLQDAVAAPRVLWDTNNRVCLELAPPDITGAHADALREMGYTNQYLLHPHAGTLNTVYFGGVAALSRRPDGTYVAVADGRRGGAARALSHPPDRRSQ